MNLIIVHFGFGIVIPPHKSVIPACEPESILIITDKDFGSIFEDSLYVRISGFPFLVSLLLNPPVGDRFIFCTKLNISFS